jgi:NTP pyrophosphatase (non-canonical NTP hydrolase)
MSFGLHRFSPWERLRKQVAAWSDRTFTQRNVTAKARHLLEEASELLHAVEHDNPYSIGEELADILMLAIHIAHCKQIDLYQALREKFEVVQIREWLAPDENGVIRHKK